MKEIDFPDFSKYIKEAKELEKCKREFLINNLESNSEILKKLKINLLNKFKDNLEPLKQTSNRLELKIKDNNNKEFISSLINTISILETVQVFQFQKWLEKKLNLIEYIFEICLYSGENIGIDILTSKNDILPRLNISTNKIIKNYKNISIHFSKDRVLLFTCYKSKIVFKIKKLDKKRQNVKIKFSSEYTFGFDEFLLSYYYYLYFTNYKNKRYFWKEVFIRRLKTYLMKIDVSSSYNIDGIFYFILYKKYFTKISKLAQSVYEQIFNRYPFEKAKEKWNNYLESFGLINDYSNYCEIKVKKNIK